MDRMKHSKVNKRYNMPNSTHMYELKWNIIVVETSSSVVFKWIDGIWYGKCCYQGSSETRYNSLYDTLALPIIFFCSCIFLLLPAVYLVQYCAGKPSSPNGQTESIVSENCMLIAIDKNSMSTSTQSGQSSTNKITITRRYSPLYQLVFGTRNNIQSNSNEEFQANRFSCEYSLLCVIFYCDARA